MSKSEAVHQNVQLDEFLVSAEDQAGSILDTLPHIPLTDERFQSVAAREPMARGRMKTLLLLRPNGATWPAKARVGKKNSPAPSSVLRTQSWKSIILLKGQVENSTLIRVASTIPEVTGTSSVE